MFWLRIRSFVLIVVPVCAQPAFYEAFGLTVVEAMTCGLPTFATAYGGPAEIIVHGVSGFHIDPYQGDKASALLVDFFEKCQTDSSHWNKISLGGLQRIEEKYAALHRTPRCGIFHGKHFDVFSCDVLCFDADTPGSCTRRG